MTLTHAQIHDLSRVLLQVQYGKHFAGFYDFDSLETAGLIRIIRPVHEQTGTPYETGHWSVEVTPEGQAAVDAHPELFGDWPRPIGTCRS